MSPYFPVVIAGAGPVGCVLALLLARAGIPVQVIEKQSKPPRDLRASTLHPSTLDLLDTLDLTGDLIALGLLAPTYQYRDRRTGARAVFDLAVLAEHTAHPYRLQCEQYKLTDLVCERLKAFAHVQVRFGSQVDSFESDATAIRVRLDSAGTKEVVDAAYLVGCDGAHSTVRKHAAIPFDGITYPEKFLVLSTDAPLEALLPEISTVNYVADADEWCTVLRTRDLWRVLFPADAATPDDELLADDAVETRLQNLAPRGARYPVVHRTLYRVHERVARTFLSGRVLLAGDAAHVNNPLGGMGMNGGLHDAFTLGRALVDSLRDPRSTQPLARYARVRREIASRYINATTARNKQQMEERDADARAARLREMQAIAADRRRSEDYLLKSAMIDSWRASERAFAAPHDDG